MKNESCLMELHIDFDKYTDGDLDFQRELVSLIATDIMELHRSIVNAFKLNDPEILRRGCHKAATTLEMIDDPELTSLINELKGKMEKAKINKSPVSEAEVLPLYKFFNEMAKSIARLNE